MEPYIRLKFFNFNQSNVINLKVANENDNFVAINN